MGQGNLAGAWWRDWKPREVGKVRRELGGRQAVVGCWGRQVGGLQT